MIPVTKKQAVESFLRNQMVFSFKATPDMQ